MNLVLTFNLSGTGHCLHSDLIDLSSIGRLEVTQASTVEFNAGTQKWEVRLASAPGVVAFSHRSRQTCLDWERDYFNARG